MDAPIHIKSMTPLVSMEFSTAEQIAQAADLLTYISPALQLTVAAPPRVFGRHSTALLEDYTDNGFPVEVRPKWSLKTIWYSIGKGPHSSTLSLKSTDFFRNMILEQTQPGFSIILSVTEGIALFGTSLNISASPW